MLIHKASNPRSTLQASAWVFLLCWSTSSALAVEPPKIRNLPIRGLRIGAVSPFVVEGYRLADKPRLLLDLPGVQQTVVSATNTRVAFEITLPDDAPPGVYPLRLSTVHGLSDPELIAVDGTPHLPFADAVADLPISLHGRVGGPLILKTQFTGRKGQRVVVDVAARRLGAEISPVLHLYRPSGVLLSWAQSSSLLGGDARIALALPDDGLYRVELHDAVFQGGARNHIRLAIGDLRCVDAVFPLGVRRGHVARLERRQAGGQSWGALNFPPPSLGDWVSTPLSSKLELGPAPGVLVSSWPELSHPDAVAAPFHLEKLPVSVSGRITHPGEVDRFTLDVSPGSQLRLELASRSFGRPFHAVVSAQDMNKNTLSLKPNPSSKSDLSFTVAVPDKTDRIQLSVADLLGLGGVDAEYRLTLLPADFPSFELELPQDALPLTQLASTVFPVRVHRRNYTGPIQISADGLPPGVSLSNAEIPSGADSALLSFTAGEPLGASTVRLIGRAEISGLRLTSAARTSQFPTAVLQPWLRETFGVHVAPNSPLRIVWTEPAADAEPPFRSLPLGGVHRAALRIERLSGSTGEVRVALVVSQPTPTKTEAGQTVDDSDRALRLEREILLPADQSTADVSILVPGDLPPGLYDLALKAELLDDSGQPTAAAWSTVRRLETYPSPSSPASKAAP